MNETDKYILAMIQTHVWSGFYSPEEVNEMIGEVLEEGADEDMLREAVGREFDRKELEEVKWPAITDCDLLDRAFAALEKRGVLCLHNAGYTMSDGHSDASAALSRKPKGKFSGYCFYHGQDLERAVDGEGLMLAFDHVDGEVPEKITIGLAIKEELERAGLAPVWDGTMGSRINLPHLVWKRRGRE